MVFPNTTFVPKTTVITAAWLQAVNDWLANAPSAVGAAAIGYQAAGTGAVVTTVEAKLRLTLNVKDFGAVGDGATDDTAAILLAYAALPATGGCLYFPAGIYILASALSFTSAKPLVIKGDGQFASQLKLTFAAGDAITVNGTSLFALLDCGIVSLLSRAATAYLLRVRNCTRPIVTNAYFNTVTGGLLMFEAVNFLQLSQLQGDTNDGTGLRVKSAGGTISNVYFRAGGSVPSLWLTGQITSLKIANCGFSGGGPHSRWAIAAIISTGVNFTVTTTSAHDFQVGDYLVLRGVTPVAYNNVFRVSAVTALTIVVNSTLNPSVATVLGMAESMSACGYVSNEDGPANESSIVNVLFEALAPNVYGTVGLYFDGRRGIALSKYSLSGWNIGEVYTDYGATGVLLSGDKGNSGNDPTVGGFTLNSLICSSTTRGIMLDQVTGVTITNCICHGAGTGTGDTLSYGTTAGLFIYAGPSAPYTQGINISGGNYGMPRNWGAGSGGLVFTSALGLDSPGIQDLVVTGITGFGSSGPVTEFNTPSVPTSRWIFKNCDFNFGAWPPTNTNYIPSVTSATTISINPYSSVQKITGIVNIQFINPARIGQELTLLFASALTLGAGGNLALAANYGVAAGQLVNFVFDGTVWYVK